MPPHSILKAAATASQSSTSDPSRKRVTFADLLTRDPPVHPVAPGTRPPITSHPIWQPLAPPIPQVVYDVCPDLAPRPVKPSFHPGPSVCNHCGERLPISRTVLKELNGRPQMPPQTQINKQVHGRHPHDHQLHHQQHPHRQPPSPPDRLREFAKQDRRIEDISRHGALATMKRYIGTSLRLPVKQVGMLDAVSESVVYRMYVACWEVRAGELEGVSVSLRRMEVRKMMEDEGRELEGLMKEKMIRMDRIEAGRWEADRKRRSRGGMYHLREFLADELEARVEEVEMLSLGDLEQVVLAVVEERVRKVRESERERAMFERAGAGAGLGGMPQQQQQTHHHHPGLMQQQTRFGYGHGAYVNGHVGVGARVPQQFVAGFAGMPAHMGVGGYGVRL